MKPNWIDALALAAVALAVVLLVVTNIDRDKAGQLLNVSYDPTRELFTDLNEQFVSKYEKRDRQNADHH